MATFRLMVYETGVSTYRVEADSKAEAIHKFFEGTEVCLS